MIDVDPLCRQWSEKRGKGQKDRGRGGEGSGHPASKTQLWYNTKYLDTTRSWGTWVVSYLGHYSLA